MALDVSSLKSRSLNLLQPSIEGGRNRAATYRGSLHRANAVYNDELAHKRETGTVTPEVNKIPPYEAQGARQAALRLGQRLSRSLGKTIDHSRPVNEPMLMKAGQLKAKSSAIGHQIHRTVGATGVVPQDLVAKARAFNKAAKATAAKALGGDIANVGHGRTWTPQEKQRVSSSVSAHYAEKATNPNSTSFDRRWAMPVYRGMVKRGNPAVQSALSSFEGSLTTLLQYSPGTAPPGARAAASVAKQRFYSGRFTGKQPKERAAVTAGEHRAGEESRTIMRMQLEKSRLARQEPKSPDDKKDDNLPSGVPELKDIRLGSRVNPHDPKQAGSRGTHLRSGRLMHGKEVGPRGKTKYTKLHIGD